MSVGMLAFLLVLVMLVALAIASFFRHTLTALAVVVAIPLWLVLQAFMGASYAVFAIALLAVFAAVIHTIGDTIRLLRTAKRTNRRAPSALAERPASTRRSDRSRIAA
jgi:heme exporter protein D